MSTIALSGRLDDPERMEAVRLLGGEPREPFFAEDYSSLKWRFTDHRDGEIARFSVCGLHAVVMDMDGDYCEWEIRRGGRSQVARKGVCLEFFEGLREAEIALREIVAARIAELRGVPTLSAREVAR